MPTYTGTDLFNMSMVLMDELSDTGTINPTQTKEYKYRAPYLLDMWQKEMAKSGDLYKTFEISCFRKKNLLGDLNHFKAIEHTGTDQTYEAVGANCFYFEVDGDCTVTITENGVPVSGKYIFNGGTETDFTGTIDITVPDGTTTFLPCKGILTTAGGNVAIKFSGTYYYKHTNRALCPYKYASADKVPDFKPWYKITMPADFKSRTQVIDEYPMWQYEEDTSHKWEGNNELYIQFGYEGIVRIKYIPIPAKITDLSQSIEIDDITAISGAYYLAEHFAMADQNDELANRCRNKFNELKLESNIKAPLTFQQIIDVYDLGR